MLLCSGMSSLITWCLIWSVNCHAEGRLTLGLGSSASLKSSQLMKLYRLYCEPPNLTAWAHWRTTSGPKNITKHHKALNHPYCFSGIALYSKISEHFSASFLRTNFGLFNARHSECCLNQGFNIMWRFPCEGI